MGGTIYLNSCDANKVAALLAGGGSASGLIALLSGGAAIAGIAVAIMGIGGTLILYNNAENTGVKINVGVLPTKRRYYTLTITKNVRF